jgi:hypothetical protein
MPKLMSTPEPLPCRWAIIFLAAVVAAMLVGGLTLLQLASWPGAALAASAAGAATVCGLHRLLGA